MMEAVEAPAGGQAADAPAKIQTIIDPNRSQIDAVSPDIKEVSAAIDKVSADIKEVSAAIDKVSAEIKEVSAEIKEVSTKLQNTTVEEERQRLTEERQRLIKNEERLIKNEEKLRSRQTGLEGILDGHLKKQSDLYSQLQELREAGRRGDGEEGQRQEKTARTESGGASDSEGEGSGGADLQATLSKLLKGQAKMQNDLSALKKQVQTLMSHDPWDHSIPSTTASKRNKLREKLFNLYGEARCLVTGLLEGEAKVVAAHIWPRAETSSYHRWKNGLKTTCLAGIDSAANGIFVLGDIEHALDRKRVCFICNPFHLTMTFKVLDPNLRAVNPTGCMKSYDELDGTTIRISDKKRPSFQVLSYHAQIALESAPEHWIDAAARNTLLNSVRVDSGSPPATSAAV